MTKVNTWCRQNHFWQPKFVSGDSCKPMEYKAWCLTQRKRLYFWAGYWLHLNERDENRMSPSLTSVKSHWNQCQVTDRCSCSYSVIGFISFRNKEYPCLSGRRKTYPSEMQLSCWSDPKKPLRRHCIRIDSRHASWYFGHEYSWRLIHGLRMLALELHWK